MVIKYVITTLCSGAVFAFIEFLIKRHDEKKNTEFDPKTVKLLLASTRAIIQDRIIYLSQEHIARGCISHDDKEDLWEIVDPYFKAGGNHRAKDYWEEVDQLPLVENYDDSNGQDTITKLLNLQENCKNGN